MNHCFFLVYYSMFVETHAVEMDGRWLQGSVTCLSFFRCQVVETRHGSYSLLVQQYHNGGPSPILPPPLRHNHRRHHHPPPRRHHRHHRNHRHPQQHCHHVCRGHPYPHPFILFLIMVLLAEIAAWIFWAPAKTHGKQSHPWKFECIQRTCQALTVATFKASQNRSC